MIKIQFPDGGIREYESGITPLQVAESISTRLAQDILVASIKNNDAEEFQIVELNFILILELQHIFLILYISYCLFKKDNKGWC